MNSTIFKHLNDCSQSRLQWKATLLFPHSINTDPVDLCEYLIPWSNDESKKQACSSYPKDTRYRFDPEQAQNESVNKLCLSANKCGYSLGLRSSNSCRPKIAAKRSDQRSVIVYLKCTRAILYRSKTSISLSSLNPSNLPSRKFATRHPTSIEQCCKFSFSIFLAPDHYWYLSTDTRTPTLDIAMHNAHMKLPHEFITPHLKRIPLLDKELIKATNNAVISSVPASILVSDHVEGHNLDPKQIQYMNNRE